MDEPAPAADRLPDGAHELVEGGPLGPDGIRHAVASLGGLGQTELRQIVHVDAPNPIVAVPPDGEHGQSAQEPGDVVEQDAIATEEDGRAHNGVRQSPSASARSTSALPRK